MVQTLSNSNIRKLPRYQILSGLRRVGVTLTDIAATVGVSVSYVSLVLARRAPLRPTANSESVWKEVERALARAA
jgi:hypothetical protein